MFFVCFVGPLRMKPTDFLPRPDKIPPGWKTTAQWAKQWKLQHRHTSRILGGAVAAGDVRCKSYRIRTGSIVRPVPHYAAA